MGELDFSDQQELPQPDYAVFGVLRLKGSFEI